MKAILIALLCLGALETGYSQTDTVFFEGKVEYQREQDGHVESSTIYFKPGHIALRDLFIDQEGNPGVSMAVFSNHFEKGAYYFIKTDWGDTVVQRRSCLEPKLDHVVNYGDDVVDSVLGRPLKRMTILYPVEPPYFAERETEFRLTDQQLIKYPEGCFVEIMSLNWRDHRLPLKVIQRYSMPIGAGKERKGEYTVTAEEVTPMTIPDEYFSTEWMMKEASPYIQK